MAENKQRKQAKKIGLVNERRKFSEENPAKQIQRKKSSKANPVKQTSEKMSIENRDEEINNEEHFSIEINDIIKDLTNKIEAKIPWLTEEVNRIIETKNTDKKAIESKLNIFIATSQIRLCDKLFIRLLDYYKTIDSEGATYYWDWYEEL